MKKFIHTFLLFTILTLGVFVIISIVLPYSKDGYIREQFVKMDLLSDTRRGPSIVLLGGSNCAFGYKSDLLENSLKVPVINAGLHAGFGLKLIVDDCFRYLHSGDILVLSPEYSHFFEEHTYGEKPLAELCYLSQDYFRLLCYRQRMVVIENLPAVFRSNIENAVATQFNYQFQSIYRSSGFNRYGDFIAHRDKNNVSYHGRISVHKHESKPNIKYFKELVSQLDTLRHRGVEVVLYPPAIAHSEFITQSKNIDWVKMSLRKAGYSFICTPEETSYSDNLFYDTAYHLSDYGAEKHTKKLIALLLNHKSIESPHCAYKSSYTGL
ncbi:MAG: hypothetical protein IJY36_03880 [Coprobacter sp.]|nr:hypothetical protein [Coprobacter sp.]